jgi:hypothetical protein
MSPFPPILTHFEAKKALAALAAGAERVSLSLDLGMSKVDVPLSGGWLTLNGISLDRAALEEIADDANKCFEVVDGGPRQIAVFSGTTGWARSLYPTAEAPTTLVAGFPMHRIKGSAPLADTRTKARALGRPRGRVLDTATGLGYTAIELAKTASEVVTVEIDPAAIELARRNPWSAELFAAENIRIVMGDVSEVIDTFADGEFGAVLHDPPTMQLAGQLYSGEFYGRLRRVLKPGGRLFHYIGDPESALGARTTRGVVNRLLDAGFRDVKRYAQAFGVTVVG